jgi:hypothetical protein
MKFKHTIFIAAAIFLGLTSFASAQWAMGHFARFRESSASSIQTPPAGFQNVYVDSTTHALSIKNSAGVSASASPTIQPWLNLTSLAASGATVTAGAGNNTTGNLITATVDGVTCTGIKFYWTGGSKTIKGAIWDKTGALIQSVNLAVTSAGEYAIAFGTPVALTPWTRYYISMYETTGTTFVYVSSANLATFTGGTLLIADTYNKQVSPGVWRGIGQFSAGDVAPVTTDNADVYPVDPVIQ